MTNERSIGGYFGLELSANAKPDVKDGIKFHTIRSALVALLSELAPEKTCRTLWFPHFICPSVEDVFNCLPDRIDLKRYNTRSDLAPDVGEVDDGDLFYSYNVFGLSPLEKRQGAIIDNAHAYFLEAVPGQHALYSARKFLGVPDGAYLRTSLHIQTGVPFCIDENALFLLSRHDQGAEIGYNTYQRWEENIFNGEVRGISNLSNAILSTLDYSQIQERRISNFGTIHSRLGFRNGLSTQIEKAYEKGNFVPYSYPFLVENGAELRQKMIANRIYSPTLWPGLNSKSGLTDFERDLAVNTVHIPIDQRYEESDMARILEVVENALV